MGFALTLIFPLRAADITATATADRPAVRLSEFVRVTLAVEGSAPLRVELPPAVVDAPSADVWRVRPLGPAATADLPDGRQRWEQSFRADPYVPGSPVRLGFAPATVSDGTDARQTDATFPHVEVRVTTDIADASTTSIRPITGVEDPPPVTPTPPPSPWPWLAAGALAALMIGSAILLRRRPVVSLSPDEAARLRLAEADAALAAGRPPAEVADTVADALRRVVGHRFGLPAERQTTPELLAAGPWPPDTADELRTVLDACDRAKFADRTADDTGEIIRRARELLPRLIPPN